MQPPLGALEKKGEITTIRNYLLFTKKKKKLVLLLRDIWKFQLTVDITVLIVDIGHSVYTDIGPAADRKCCPLGNVIISELTLFAVGLCMSLAKKAWVIVSWRTYSSLAILIQYFYTFLMCILSVLAYVTL